MIYFILIIIYKKKLILMKFLFPFLFPETNVKKAATSNVSAATVKMNNNSSTIMKGEKLFC